MATYDEWNFALLSYFTEGVPSGSGVFLSVDDDVIADVFGEIQPSGAGSQVGNNSSSSTSRDPLSDFCQAVAARVVDDNYHVHLSSVRGRDSRGYPRGIAFLGCMVVAASRMSDDEEMSGNNYFGRLREVLGIPPGEGRPDGMRPGAEAEPPLWREWNLWLQENGFLPTAQPGEGPLVYIGYPLTQALLRQADKDRLWRLFQEEGWTADWDVDTLYSHVRKEVDHLTRHLRELHTAGGSRLDAVAEAIHDVYDAWKEDPQLSRTAIGRASKSYLLAGLYRVENLITGVITYYLYPRQTRGRRVGEVRVQCCGEVYVLRPSRQGWYAPVAPVQEADISSGLRYSVEKPQDIDHLVLPQRDFWILVPDPEDIEPGVYASWGAPSLGVKFLLLCRKELFSQLEYLRSERLIEWSYVNTEVLGGDSWIELRDCWVVSEAWAGVFIQRRDLVDALRPRSVLSINLSGGLRVPGIAAAWLEGHGPEIRIRSFESSVMAQVVNAENDSAVLEDGPKRTNEPLAVDWPAPGTYRIEARVGADREERVVRVVAWDELRIVQPEYFEEQKLGGTRVRGALIEPSS